MNLKGRIQGLEARLLPNFITLKLRDGTIHKIRDDCLLETFCYLLAGKQSPILDKILQTVESDEPGHMIDLIQAIAAGPVPDQKGEKLY